jgi:hypothetical protein
MVSAKTISIVASLVLLSMSLSNQAESISLEKTVNASELATAPNQMIVRVFKNRGDTDPIAVQTYYSGEWKTSMDISRGFPTEAAQVQFSFQFDQLDKLDAGETLWVETSMDGKVVGERAAYKAPSNAAFNVDNENGVIFQGTFGSGSIPLEGAGTRMMWYPAKGAFRAGRVNSDHWNAANIGDGSTAMGYNTTASGFGSTAMGESTTASGLDSTAMGWAATAGGDYSTAMGFETIASGSVSTAMGASSTASAEGATAMGSATIASGLVSTALGVSTEAESYAETVIGSFDTNYIPEWAAYWDPDDRLFVIGNGETEGTRSDAMVVLKNGNTGIGDSNPINTLEVVGSINTTDCLKVDGVSIAGDCPSDLRLKKKVTPLKNSLGKLSQLNPVHWEWRVDRKDILGESDHGVGLVAQDVEKVMPHLVTEGADGYKRIRYDLELQMHMLAAIKELKAENEKLRGELERSKSSQQLQIEKLTQKIQAMEQKEQLASL